MRCASTALVACKGAPIPPELGPHSSSALRAWCAPGPHGSLPWRGRRRRTLSLVTGKAFHFSFWFRKTLFHKSQSVLDRCGDIIDEDRWISETSFRAPTESTAAEFVANNHKQSHTHGYTYREISVHTLMNTCSCMSSMYDT